MNQAKAWWTSKTIWTNLVALIGVIVVSTGFDAGNWAEISTVALAAVNVVLRMVTKDPVALASEQSS
jgi:hypothetical protein